MAGLEVELGGLGEEIGQVPAPGGIGEEAGTLGW